MYYFNKPSFPLILVSICLSVIKLCYLNLPPDLIADALKVLFSLLHLIDLIKLFEYNKKIKFKKYFKIKAGVVVKMKMYVSVVKTYI